MDLQNIFFNRFGFAPEFVVRAPGRVNLIGEHTDYNDGFVFPAAIKYDVMIAASPRTDRLVKAFAVSFNQYSEFSLDNLIVSEDARWSNYMRGVAKILKEEGHDPCGMDVVITGDVPVASGLSSSAAMEVASCLAYETAAGFDVGFVQRALIGQRAEREFVGVQCGIMDQFISSLGKADHALFIDTRTLAYEPVPLPSIGAVMVIMNTNVPRELVASAYNTRRSECEEAVLVIRRYEPRVIALRDVDEAMFARYADRMAENVGKRARHVVSEDARVLKSIDALKSGDIVLFGKLMNASHDSLRDDYEVTGLELDAIVDAARRIDGVFGARMTGAGFGGCAVALVQEESVDALIELVGAEYRAVTGLEASFYVTGAADGANRIA